MARPQRRKDVPRRTIQELLPDKAWIADQSFYDDGDMWPIFPGRVAEYVHERRALVVRENGEEIGFVPVFGSLRG